MTEIGESGGTVRGEGEDGLVEIHMYMHLIVTVDYQCFVQCIVNKSYFGVRVRSDLPG